MPLTSANVNEKKFKKRKDRKCADKPSKTSVFSDEYIAQIFTECEFNYTRTAKALGVCRSSVHNMMNNREFLREKVWAVQEAKIEHVENQLFKKIDEGDIKAIIFFLERRSDKYKKSVEISGTVKTITRVITAKMSDEEAADTYKQSLGEMV